MARYKRQEFINDKTVISAEHFEHIETGILNCSGNTVIPSYWESYMKEKISEINEMNEKNGQDADVFIYLTDTHFPNNSGNCISLIKYITENTSVNKVIIAGDLIEGNQGNSVDMDLLRSIKKELRGLQIFPVRGNHDAHTSKITDSQWWDVFTRNLDYCVRSGMYYYYDNVVNRIRYIFADSVWGYGEYSDDYTSQEQLEWIKLRILELESDWTVIVIKHHLWDWNALGTLNAEGVLIKGVIDEVYDSAKCSIAGVYAGHSHADYCITSDKGYILVTTIGDNNQVSGWQNGTIKEHAFDVVSFNPITKTIKTIRIGNRGANRTFNYI